VLVAEHILHKGEQTVMGDTWRWWNMAEGDKDTLLLSRRVEKV
jgi:hypothetical protein